MRRPIALIALLLLVSLAGGMGLWLRSARHQYALNRHLICALVKGDDKKALALVDAGADPNTRYKPMPVPSLLELVNQLLHRSLPPKNALLLSAEESCLPPEMQPVASSIRK